MTCPAGYACKDASSAPVRCPVGRYAPIGSSACLPCPDGFACPSADALPVACALSEYSPLGASVCRPCPPGYSCATAQDIADGRAKSSKPEPCPAGTFSLAGSAVCTACPAGSFCANPASSPVQCPASTYSTIGAATCSVCPAGSACPFAGTTAPIACPAGFYSETGSFECTACPRGSYCPRGASSPTLCPIGTKDAFPSIVAGEGLRTSEADTCMRCPAGTAGADPRRLSCLPCAAGHVCLMGATTVTPTNLVRDHGYICPAGHFCTEGSSEPVACTAGTFSAELGMKKREACKQCPLNTYSERSGSKACTPCGPHARAAIGSTVCQCVGANRVYFPSDGSCRCRGGFTWYKPAASAERDFNALPSISRPGQPALASYEGGVSGLRSSADGSKDCVPIPLQQCQEHEVRSAFGECVDPLSPTVCVQACSHVQVRLLPLPDGIMLEPEELEAARARAQGTFDRNLGICLCASPATEDLLDGVDPASLPIVTISSTPMPVSASDADALSWLYDSPAGGLVNTVHHLSSSSSPSSSSSSSSSHGDTAAEISTSRMAMYALESLSTSNSASKMSTASAAGPTAVTTQTTVTVTDPMTGSIHSAPLSALPPSLASSLHCPHGRQASGRSDCRLVTIVSSSVGQKAVLGVPSFIAEATGATTSHRAAIVNTTSSGVVSPTTTYNVADRLAAMKHGVQLTESISTSTAASGPRRTVRLLVSTKSPSAQAAHRRAHTISQSERALQARLAEADPIYRKNVYEVAEADYAAAAANANADGSKEDEEVTIALQADIQYGTADDDKYTGYLYSTTCIATGDSIVWLFQDSSHFPIYLKDNALNTNPTFDYSAFTQVETNYFNGVNVTSLSQTFTQTGTYVFADHGNQYHISIVKVVTNANSCPATSTSTSSATAVALAIASAYNVAVIPDLTVIYILICVFVGVAVVLAFFSKLTQYQARRAAIAAEAPSDSLALTSFRMLHFALEKQQADHNDLFSDQIERFRAECDRIAAETEQIKALLAVKITENSGFLKASKNLLMAETTARQAFDHNQSSLETKVLNLLAELEDRIHHELLASVQTGPGSPLPRANEAIIQVGQELSTKITELTALSRKERQRRQMLIKNSGILGDEIVGMLNQHDKSIQDLEGELTSLMSRYREEFLEPGINNIIALDTQFAARASDLKKQRNQAVVDNVKNRFKLQLDEYSRKIIEPFSPFDADYDSDLALEPKMLEQLVNKLRSEREMSRRDGENALLAIRRLIAAAATKQKLAIFNGVPPELEKAMKLFLCQAGASIMPDDVDFGTLQSDRERDNAAAEGSGMSAEKKEPEYVDALHDLMMQGITDDYSEPGASSSTSSIGGAGAGAGSSLLGGIGSTSSGAMGGSGAGGGSGSGSVEEDVEALLGKIHDNSVTAEDVKSLYAAFLKKQELMERMLAEQKEHSIEQAQELLKLDIQDRDDQEVLDKATAMFKAMLDEHEKEKQQLLARLAEEQEAEMAREIEEGAQRAAEEAKAFEEEKRRLEEELEMKRRQVVPGSDEDHASLSEHILKLKKLEEAKKQETQKYQQALRDKHQQWKTKRKREVDALKLRQNGELKEKEKDYKETVSRIRKKEEEENKIIGGVDIAALAQQIQRVGLEGASGRGAGGAGAGGLGGAGGAGGSGSGMGSLGGGDDMSGTGGAGGISGTIYEDEDAGLEDDEEIRAEKKRFLEELAAQKRQQLQREHEDAKRKLELEIERERASQLAEFEAEAQRRKEEAMAQLNEQQQVAAATTESASDEGRRLLAQFDRDREELARKMDADAIAQRAKLEQALKARQANRQKALARKQNLEVQDAQVSQQKFEKTLTERAQQAKEESLLKTVIEEKQLDSQTGANVISSVMAERQKKQLADLMREQREDAARKTRAMLDDAYADLFNKKENIRKAREDGTIDEEEEKRQLEDIAKGVDENALRQKIEDEIKAKHDDELKNAREQYTKEIKDMFAKFFGPQDIDILRWEDKKELQKRLEEAERRKKEEEEEILAKQRKIEEEISQMKAEAEAKREEQMKSEMARIEATIKADQERMQREFEANQEQARKAKEAELAERERQMREEAAQAQDETERTNIMKRFQEEADARRVQDDLETKRQQIELQNRLQARALDRKKRLEQRAQDKVRQQLEQDEALVKARQEEEKLRGQQMERERAMNKIRHDAAFKLIKAGKTIAMLRQRGVNDAVTLIKNAHVKSRETILAQLKAAKAGVGVGVGAIGGAAGAADVSALTNLPEAVKQTILSSLPGGAAALDELTSSGSGQLRAGTSDAFVHKVDRIEALMRKVVKDQAGHQDGQFKPAEGMYIDAADEALAPSPATAPKQPVAVQPNAMSAREFLVYRYAVYVADYAAQSLALPTFSLLIASQLPVKKNGYKFEDNVYKNSFHYDSTTRTIFIHKARMQHVGRLALIVAHVVAHISVNEWHDDSVKFQRNFSYLLSSLLAEFFFSRTSLNASAAPVSAAAAGMSASGDVATPIADAAARATAGLPSASSWAMELGDAPLQRAHSSTSWEDVEKQWTATERLLQSNKELRESLAPVTVLSIKEDVIGDFLDVTAGGSDRDDFFALEDLFDRMNQYRAFREYAPLKRELMLIEENVRRNTAIHDAQAEANVAPEAKATDQDPDDMIAITTKASAGKDESASVHFARLERLRLHLDKLNVEMVTLVGKMHTVSQRVMEEEAKYAAIVKTVDVDNGAPLSPPPATLQQARMVLRRMATTKTALASRIASFEQRVAASSKLAKVNDGTQAAAHAAAAAAGNAADD